jgi:HrpA-like RNA helicase
VVIDTCKEKQSSFDPVNRMPLLLEVFASQDSLRQRRGRAGRVRPGVCYKLISKQHHSTLPPHGTPEIKRSAIEQTLLSLIFLGLEDGSGNFLRSMIDPPSKESIESAMSCLEQLGAIEREGDTATLCPLGRHLSGIPAPPTVAKLLVMGSLLGCRSIALAIAAGLSVGRSPFIRLGPSLFQRRDSNNPVDQEKQAANDQILEARKKLFKSVGNSEHCMLGKAYLLWDDAKGAERRKCCGKISSGHLFLASMMLRLISFLLFSYQIILVLHSIA